MKKNFFANIEEEKVLFFSIELDSNMVPANNSMLDKDHVLSNNPTVLNITHLNYFPARRSIWDGQGFIAPEGEEHKLPCNPDDLCLDGCQSIAFIIDNVYYGGIGLCVGVSNNDMVIAALSSNPTITFELAD